ncbi:hypothetical protein BKA60DRAFT_660210 [Fusarium oxysporum]|nr:hypothetical protein BKA60DRAFT_660210 [Fusarium oxysporum]
MEPYLLSPDGLISVPEIFGQNGIRDNGPVIGPSSIDYGTVVGLKGKKMVFGSGSDQVIGKASQADYFYANGMGAMMSLNIPEGFALVLSYRARYFRLAIFLVGEKPYCVTAFKITHDESIECLHSRLTYNIQPEEVNPRDLTTGKERQLVTHKVQPNQGKIIATSGPLQETFDHTLFQSGGGCYVWIHNGEIERSETCLLVKPLNNSHPTPIRK